MGTVRPLVSVVIPAYNEEVRLPGTLEQVVAYLERQDYPWEVIVVDDGSEDRTAEIAEGFAQRYPGVRVIRNPHRGKGYTVRTGMLAGQGDYILFSDADLATPIEELEKLLAYLERGYDVAIGSREGVGAVRHGEPWFRHFIGRVFNLLVRLVAVGDFQDTQCGFKAFRQQAAKDIFSSLRLYGEDAPEIKGGAVTAFDVELLFLALKKGYKVKEVPVVWRYGKHSKVNPLRDSIHMFRDVLAVRWNDWRGLYG
ncbi:MAG: glycosyltransferase family 2 protein [Anaerolineae bacterium]|nr:glycosyltransferase family 2 protein [Anaerolineae bacterium]